MLLCKFQVLQRIYDSNIRNYTIYYDKYHHLLFSHMEYIGKSSQKGIITVKQLRRKSLFSSRACVVNPDHIFYTFYSVTTLLNSYIYFNIILVLDLNLFKFTYVQKALIIFCSSFLSWHTCRLAF